MSSVALRSLCSLVSRPASIAARLPAQRSMSSGSIEHPIVHSAFTSSANPNVQPHYAPASHAPAEYAKNRVQFQVDNPAVS
jgi:hypothetical protein